MDRMGHSSSRAALIYLHGSDERQQIIADAISEQARKAPAMSSCTSHRRAGPGEASGM
jgi:hypothetical protein